MLVLLQRLNGKSRIIGGTLLLPQIVGASSFGAFTLLRSGELRLTKLVNAQTLGDLVLLGTKNLALTKLINGQTLGDLVLLGTKHLSLDDELINADILGALTLTKVAPGGVLMIGSELIDDDTLGALTLTKVDFLTFDEFINSDTLGSLTLTKYNIGLSNLTVEENQILNDVIGSLSTTGGLSGETFSYSLLDSNTGRFAVSGSNLVVNTAIGSEFNYDQATSRSVTVRATGSMGSTFDKSLSLWVLRHLGWDPRYGFATITRDWNGFNNQRDAKVQGVNATTVFGGIYADQILPLGQKSYWEVQLGGDSTGTVYAGAIAFGISEFAISNVATPGFAWANTNVVFNNNLGATGTTGFTVNTDRLMFAYDGSTGKFWFGKNGSWVDSGDPASGANPKGTIAAAGLNRLLRPFVRMTPNTSGTHNLTAQICTASGDLTYTPPTGFSAISYAAPASGAFNPGQVGANFTLSNGNRTVIKSTGTLEQLAATNTGFTGKMVWAVKIDKYTSGTARVGHTNYNNLTTSVGATDTWIRLADGVTANAGSTTGTPTYGAIATGDILMFAVDMATKKVWFGKNGTWFASGDPAAGTGNAFLDDTQKFPFVSFTTVGDGATLLGGVNYPYAIPSGFRAWDDTAPYTPDAPATLQVSDVPTTFDGGSTTTVTDTASDPSPTAVTDTENAFSTTDASSSLTSDSDWSTKRVIGPSLSGAARGLNALYGMKYWEIFHWYGSNDLAQVGVMDATASLSIAPGEDSHGIGYRNDGHLRQNGADLSTSYATYDTRHSVRDVIGVAFDSATRQIWFSKNGVWQSGTPGMTTLGTVTMTIASPCVVSRTAHGLSTNTPVMLSTTGALPTGLSPWTVYYADVIDANTFHLKAKPSGANINTSGTQSGTHTGYSGVGSTPSATLAAGTYYPAVWFQGSTGANNILGATFSTLHSWGAFRRRVYTPPLGFSSFKQNH